MWSLWGHEGALWGVNLVSLGNFDFGCSIVHAIFPLERHFRWVVHAALGGVAIWGSDFWAAPQLGYAGLTPKFWALTDTANLRKWPGTGFAITHTITL